MKLCVEGPTLGVTLQTLAVPGITLTEARYAPGTRFPWHTHRKASLCLVLDGTITEQSGSTTYELGRYDVLYKRMDVEHANAIGASGAHVIIVELDTPWLARYEPQSQQLLKYACVIGAAPAELTQRLHSELLRPDAVTSLAVQSICLELLVNVVRASSAGEQRRVPQWLKRAREILHQDCTEHRTLDQIADEVGVHPVHLAQVFRRTFGVTIGEYTRRLRIRRGARELVQTQRPIADIAMDCGFCDQSHFSRVFKHVTSATPAEYRRSASAGTSPPELETPVL